MDQRTFYQGPFYPTRSRVPLSSFSPRHKRYLQMYIIYLTYCMYPSVSQCLFIIILLTPLVFETNEDFVVQLLSLTHYAQLTYTYMYLLFELHPQIRPMSWTSRTYIEIRPLFSSSVHSLSSRISFRTGSKPGDIKICHKKSWKYTLIDMQRPV